MIALHSVSKEVRSVKRRKLVLDRIDWHIPARSQVVILGQKGAGKSTLMQMINGARYPTSGWVERRGSICAVTSLTKIRGARTPRQFAIQLAHLYKVDADALISFVADFAEFKDVMNVPVTSIPRAIRSRLNYALAYGIPFDFYLFDGALTPSKDQFARRCQAALEMRCRNAGVLFATSVPKLAEKFSDASGAILHQGRLQLFPSVKEAIAVFQTLPPPVPELTFHVAPEEFEETTEQEFM